MDLSPGALKTQTRGHAPLSAGSFLPVLFRIHVEPYDFLARLAPLRMRCLLVKVGLKPRVLVFGTHGLEEKADSAFWLGTMTVDLH